MTETKQMEATAADLKPKLRNGLFVLQILLPFAGFIALQSGNGLLSGVIAALFVLSMLVLVVLG
ncbi:hypothetical protein KQH62_00590 [bacterium]|nr:hypothetical protein [bacterium]